MDTADVLAFHAEEFARHRDRRLQVMAGFCKYWGMTPAEYDQLTLERLEAMTKFANDDIKERKRQARKGR